jgi:hypothetical protein
MAGGASVITFLVQQRRRSRVQSLDRLPVMTRARP